MAAVISFTVPNQPAAYPMGGTVSPFAGYNFAVLQDGTITIVASGGIAGVAWLGFSGAPVGFTVLAGANGELTLSGQASAIVGALQQGAITLTGGLAPNFYGFSVPSAWIQTNFTETPAVFSNSVATFTDPGLLSSSLDFFQFGQQVDLQPGNWQLTFSYALTDGASHGTYGLPYLSIGWFKDSVGNNVDTNAQLPQFMVTSLSSGTAQLTFTLTSEVKDFLTFEGGNANVTIGSPLLGVLPPVSLSISGPGTFVSGTTATTTTTISDTGTPACFAAGTRIQTAGGDVAVEALRAGDLVATVLGGLRPVIWVGHTRIDLDRHPRAEELAPIRVAADAFGPGRPRRDLLLSPDHALHVDGALIPVHLLVNGATIAREPARGRVTYFHVELESHDILLAEGLAAESYLDTGNRASFANGGPMRTLHADPSLGAAALAVWAAAGCAPLRLEGPAVLAAHRRLRERAVALGHRLATDAALRIEGDGRALEPLAAAPGFLRVRLPPGTREVRLRSLSMVPEAIDRALCDRRRLGVAVLAISLDGRALALDGEGFGAGFYPTEESWRWTDGDGRLALAPRRRGQILEITTTVFACRYWVPEAAPEAARAA